MRSDKHRVVGWAEAAKPPCPRAKRRGDLTNAWARGLRPLSPPYRLIVWYEKAYGAADGDGRVPAGAELHQPAGLVAASRVARRFHVGGLLPGDRPDRK